MKMRWIKTMCGTLCSCACSLWCTASISAPLDSHFKLENLTPQSSKKTDGSFSLPSPHRTTNMASMSETDRGVMSAARMDGALSNQGRGDENSLHLKTNQNSISVPGIPRGRSKMDLNARIDPSDPSPKSILGFHRDSVGGASNDMELARDQRLIQQLKNRQLLPQGKTDGHAFLIPRPYNQVSEKSRNAIDTQSSPHLISSNQETLMRHRGGEQHASVSPTLETSNSPVLRMEGVSSYQTELAAPAQKQLSLPDMRDPKHMLCQNAIVAVFTPDSARCGQSSRDQKGQKFAVKVGKGGVKFSLSWSR